MTTNLYFPPPVGRPCFIYETVGTSFVGKVLDSLEHHLIFEGWVPEDFLDTFKGVTPPEFQFLVHHLPIRSLEVSRDVYNVTRPIRTAWKLINFFK